jgi:hypothetical protein
VVNIGIKSGTDDIHGSAYYFHRNEAFDARNYFDHTTDPVTGEESKAAGIAAASIMARQSEARS